MVETLRTELAERETAVMDLRDTLKATVREAEETRRLDKHQREQMTQQLALAQAELKVKARAIGSLEDEIVSLKRESAKYVTTISHLNRNMVQLNEQLEDVNIRVQHQEECNRHLQAEMAQKGVEHHLTVVRISGQLQQYAKVSASVTVQGISFMKGWIVLV